MHVSVPFAQGMCRTVKLIKFLARKSAEHQVDAYLDLEVIAP